MNIAQIDQALCMRHNDMVTCAPCMAFFVFLDHTEPEVVLDFYHKVREALGSLITHVSKGKGFTKLNKRSETTVEGWCKALKSWQKHNYWVSFSGADKSVTDAQLNIQVLHRNLKALSKADEQYIRNDWTRKLEVNPDAYSLPCTNFRVTFPLNHALAQPQAFKAWILSLQAIADWPFVYASAGLSFNYAHWASDAQINRGLMNHVPSIMRRYPGLDFQLPYNALLLRYHREWIEQHDYLLPLIGRSNWLTAVNISCLDFMGGSGTVKTRLQQHPNITVDTLAQGLLVQAGEEPLLGDVEVPESLNVYRQVAGVLQPGRIPFNKLMRKTFLSPEVLEEWWYALDADTSE